MPGVVRPPYGAPTGPLTDDHSLIRSFASGARTGHSPALHIEEDTLLHDRFVPVAIRLGDGAVLLRADVDTAELDERLSETDLTLIERDPPLATVVALQSLGLPAATWDLWGRDAATAQAALRTAAEAGAGGPWAA